MKTDKQQRKPAEPCFDFEARERMAHAMRLAFSGYARSPAWRWELAKIFRKDSAIAVVLRHRVDPWIGHLELFQSDLLHCRTDSRHRSRWPVLAKAHELYSGLNNHMRCAELEARLLAAESSDHICRQMLFESAEIVDCYERTFFNVSDRLENTSWIVAAALEGGCYADKPDLRTAWKYYGYFGGPDVLDLVLSVTKCSRPSPDRNTKGLKADAEQVRLMFDVKSAIAIKFLPMDDSAQKWLLRFACKQFKIEKRYPTGGEVHARQMAQNHEAFLKGIDSHPFFRMPEACDVGDKGNGGHQAYGHQGQLTLES